MKTKNIFNYRLIGIFSMLILLVSACSKDKVDIRQYEGVKIVGVKVNSELFTPTYINDITQVVIPAGRDLSKVNLQLLVINGEAISFDENADYDCRKPFRVSLKGKDGQQKETTLKIQSPPALSSFIIEGLTVPSGDIHFSTSSLIVQVPEATDLTHLKVTMDFINGTLSGFTNGVSVDYTTAKSFKLTGLDGETIYTYDFIITTEQIGPASVKAMTINGIATDSVVFEAPSTLIPYVKGLTNFSKSEITLETGFGNRIDPAFINKDLNLLSGAVKVKITGSDGIEKEFTIAKPQISMKPIFSKNYSEFGFGAEDLPSIAFSGNHIVASNYTNSSKGTIKYYNLSGEYEGVLDVTDVVIRHSLRKLASDSKGNLLVADLGISAEEQTVYKWNNVIAKPVPYIKYTKASLGLDYNPRSAGINVAGSLDGDAIIVIGMAQKTDLFVWTVTGGILNPTPQKLAFPYTGASYYWSIEPLPIGSPGFVGAAVGNTFNGLIALTSTMGEIHKQSGIVVTDCRAIRYKERIYLAYTAYGLGKGAFMRVCDITDGQADSYKNPIFDVLMPASAPNVNNTMDADLAVINDKLHAVFSSTNIGVRLYKLEE